MNESKKRFVEDLLAADPPSPNARRNYDKEIRAMLEKTLTPGQRRAYLFAAVLMGLLAMGYGLMLLGGWMYHRDYATPLLPFFLLTAPALLVVAGLFFWNSWQGVVNRRTSNDWAAGAGVAYVSLMGCAFLMMSESWPEQLRDVVRVLGMMLLGYAAVAWLRQRIGQTELRTAEKLLEIELRLAEIGETLEARSKPPDPTSPQPPSREPS
jgi:cation transport ATPase